MHINLQRIFAARNAISTIDSDNARLAEVQTIGFHKRRIFTRNQRLDTQRARGRNLGKARAGHVNAHRQRVHIKNLRLRVIYTKGILCAGQHSHNDRILSGSRKRMIRTLQISKFYGSNYAVAGIAIIVCIEICAATSKEEEQRKHQSN